MTKDEILSLAEDESVGVISGEDSWESLIDNQKRITTRYLQSWEQWNIAKDGSLD
jgi:hypothetical protein